MVMLRSTLAIWILVLVDIVAVAHGTQECDLECDPDQSLGCLSGPANFSDHLLPDGQPLSFHEVTASQNNMHCECLSDWTGLECKHKFTSCHDGAHNCYNGGECVETTDILRNDIPSCDCKKAVDEEGVRYAGQYCEHPAVDVCDDRRQVFCVNGGTCKTDL